ncbi:MAG TPA: site-specific integrase, partial [Edaphobacter sp.]|nr:site-specific integrase [Edaphobacter sp.]
RVRTVANAAAVYLKEYKLKHRAVSFAEYAVRHLCEHLGSVMLAAINDGAISDYQLARLEEKAAPKTINDEVGTLLRIMGDRGDLLRSRLRRKRKLNLAVSEQPGKAFNVEEKDAMMRAAQESRSPLILPALTLALNAGMRDSEIKRTQWSQIDFSKRILTVGRSKTAAGEGRTIPLNSEILPALTGHAQWYAKKFGALQPEWYVFPFGRRGKMDPTRHVTTLKTAWGNVRTKADVKGRWHDNRHTLITELAESGAGDETIMAIAGHVSRRMLSRYSHIRTQAKRSALEDVVARREQQRTLNKEAAEKEAAEAVTVN